MCEWALRIPQRTWFLLYEHAPDLADWFQSLLRSLQILFSKDYQAFCTKVADLRSLQATGGLGFALDTLRMGISEAAFKSPIPASEMLVQPDID